MDPQRRRTRARRHRRRGGRGVPFAYTLMTSGLAQEIILIDKDEQRANGEAMDLNHGLSFVPPVEVRAGSYADCEGIVRQLPAQLSEAEAEQVRQSAAKLKDIQDSLKG